MKEEVSSFSTDLINKSWIKFNGTVFSIYYATGSISEFIYWNIDQKKQE